MNYLDILVEADFTGIFEISYEGVEGKHFSPFLRNKQYFYIVTLLGEKLANEYISQLDTNVPQNSTVTKWINLHQDIKEYLIRMIFSESMRYFRSFNANGKITDSSELKALQLRERETFREGVVIGNSIINTILDTPDFEVTCKCELGSLQYILI